MMDPSFVRAFNKNPRITFINGPALMTGPVEVGIAGMFCIFDFASRRGNIDPRDST